MRVQVASGMWRPHLLRGVDLCVSGRGTVTGAKKTDQIYLRSRLALGGKVSTVFEAHGCHNAAWTLEGRKVCEVARRKTFRQIIRLTASFLFSVTSHLQQR